MSVEGHGRVYVVSEAATLRQFLASCPSFGFVFFLIVGGRKGCSLSEREGHGAAGAAFQE